MQRSRQYCVAAVDVSRAWAGGQALSVLATPLNVLILRALGERPMRLAELRKATGLPAQTTLRGHLANLGEIGVWRSGRPSGCPTRSRTS